MQIDLKWQKTDHSVGGKNKQEGIEGKDTQASRKLEKIGVPSLDCGDGFTDAHITLTKLYTLGFSSLHVSYTTVEGRDRKLHKCSLLED